jgi:release factor glutamine methyltransferase
VTSSFSAHDAEAALVREAIPVVRLFGGTAEKGARLLLVQPETAARAERSLEATPWRYRAGGRGSHRFRRHSLFAWDGGTSVALVSGLPAGPLPSRTLAALERRVWRHATETPSGIREPDPIDAVLVAAVQIVRPGFPRPAWRREFLRLTELNELEAETAAAQEVGLARSLWLARRAVGLASPDDEPRAALYEQVWGASRRLQRGTRSRRLSALLEGAPIPGHAVFRTRFADREVESGRGVFLPVPFSEELLGAGLERLVNTKNPIVVEVGTGCGAVAVAVVSARRDSDVHAVDVSGRALRWARRNARRLGAGNTHFYRGSLLEPLPSTLHGRVDAVLTNVPYAPRSYRQASWDDMPGTVEGEGDDGLGLPRSLADGARRFLSDGGWLVAQVATEQVEAFGSELGTLGYVDFDRVAIRAGDAVVVARLSGPG